MQDLRRHWSASAAEKTVTRERQACGSIEMTRARLATFAIKPTDCVLKPTASWMRSAVDKSARLPTTSKGKPAMPNG